MSDCIFCGLPANPDLGRHYKIAVNAATVLDEFDDKTAEMMVPVFRALAEFKIGTPTFGEEIVLYDGRDPVIVHPGCHQDWAHDQAYDREIEQQIPDPDVEVGFGQILPAFEQAILPAFEQAIDAAIEAAANAMYPKVGPPPNGMDRDEPFDPDLTRDLIEEALSG